MITAQTKSSPVVIPDLIRNLYKKTFSNFSSGFTLIELMVVIAVIAILATIALFGLNKAQASARDVKRYAIMTGMQVMLECFMRDNGQYPVSATFSWTAPDSAAPNGVGTACIPAGTKFFDPVGNVQIIGTNGTGRNGVGGSYTYVYSSTATTYSLTLTGETGTKIWNNPN